MSLRDELGGEAYVHGARKALEAAIALCEKNQKFYRAVAEDVGADTYGQYVGASHCETHIRGLLDELV